MECQYLLRCEYSKGQAYDRHVRLLGRPLRTNNELNRSRVGIGAPQRMLRFGLAAMDARLPGGGIPRGRVRTRSRAAETALSTAPQRRFAAGVVARTRGKVLWCITRPDLSAPALSLATQAEV